MTQFTSRLTAGSAAAALALAGFASPAMADHAPGHEGSAGDETLVVPINDSTAGGTYDQVFERAFVGTSTDGTPVYIYVPEGALDGPDDVASLDRPSTTTPATSSSPAPTPRRPTSPSPRRRSTTSAPS
jgi:hypothetical protein